MDNLINDEKKQISINFACFSLAVLSPAGVKMDTSTGTTAVLFQGRTHKSNLHHQL
jgi:hypothetical protein